MNRTLRPLFASVAVSLLMPLPVALAHSTDPSHHDHHYNREEMTKECKEGLEQVRNAGAALPEDHKAEFDYNLESAGVELKALEDNRHNDIQRHARFCQSRLKEARHIVKKHEAQMAREKKKEERKAQAEERKAAREAAKAKKEAERAEKIEHHHHGKSHEIDGLDHGKSEGASTKEPGADVAKPVS